MCRSSMKKVYVNSDVFVIQSLLNSIVLDKLFDELMSDSITETDLIHCKRKKV